MAKSQQMKVLGAEITVQKINQNDFISITDIARYKNSKTDQLIQNWMRNRNTLEFLGLREKINNPHYKPLEFEGFAKQAGLHSFLMSPNKWIAGVNAIGLISKSGKNGGTYAHKDIALEFANWISVEFKLFFIKEFQRLKEQEMRTQDRTVKRFLTKMNYKIHTDAIKACLIPLDVTPTQINFVYADEADILNVALFGQTAKERRDKNPKTIGNIRDEATLEQLIVLANMESINAEYIKLGLPQSKRLELLNKTAISQMRSLLDSPTLQKLPTP